MSSYEDAVRRAQDLLLRAAKTAAPEELRDLALQLAESLLTASTSSAETHERERAERLSALMSDRSGQVFATALTDRVHRSTSGARLVEQVLQLIQRLGVPRSLARWDRLELRALQAFGSGIPELTARAVQRRIFQDAAPYIIPAEPVALESFLRERRRQNVRVNVNHLGEEVMGNQDAAHYLETYLELLARPEVDTISVKLSSIDSQLDVLAWDKTLARLRPKLERIYRTALKHSGMGSVPGRQKLVYLDMEAYRELELTFDLFRQLLSQPELQGLTAGIVLQAYLPDSFEYQKRLIAWAEERVKGGGAPLRMRLVKGANLAVERIESSLHGLSLAPYGSKHEVDANFKRMLRYALSEGRSEYVRLGVGSHNLFDIAYALTLRAAFGLERQVELEMLEGMADPLRRVVQRVAGSVLVYAPSVAEKNFSSAVAYLVRRLDENTAEENFLRHSFAMQSNDASFDDQKRRFLEALGAADTTSAISHRQQNQAQPVRRAPLPHFANEPISDFSRAQNRLWIGKHLQQQSEQVPELRSQIAGQARDGAVTEGFDPSRPGHVPYRCHLLDAEGVQAAIAHGHDYQQSWQRVPALDREALLFAVAQALREQRGPLIAAMVTDAGKRVVEADAEVSEAIDFAEYYARQHARLRERFVLSPKGLTLVTPPWNFPLAIGLGSALAALVCGNAVLLKPPPETRLVLARAAELCFDAGVDRRALSLLLVEDEHATPLITDPRVKVVMLTGGTETARLFQRLRPDLDLVAETGGKNAIIVSAMSDREQAVGHVVRSAFGHAGQKCSACSLLILEREVYRSATFRRQLADATESLPVGSAWELDSFVTPLIREPEGALARGLNTLDAGEQWLIKPRLSPDNPRLYSPGVRYEVAPDSFAHTVELFGPVLSVLEARDFEHALELANATPYGLTAGLQSLDAQEIAQFRGQMRAGNLYINRPITGAIVGRQPFGGRKASACGKGFKAGGPNTLLALCQIGEQRPGTLTRPLSSGPARSQDRVVPKSAPRPPGEMGKPENTPLGARLHAQLLKVLSGASTEQRQQGEARLKSYREAAEREFWRLHPQDHVLGHHDELAYVPCSVLIVAALETSALDVLSALHAAILVGATPCLMLPREAACTETLASLGPLLYDDVQAVGDELVRGGYERLRYLAEPMEPAILELSVLVSKLDHGPPQALGELELLSYVAEQSVSIAWHRHGNLGLPLSVGEKLSDS